MQHKGRTGEIKAYNYFIKQGYNVIDTTNDARYFEDDIDMIVSKDGVQTTIEVKWDYNIERTTNIFAEYVTDIDKCKDGWYKKCKAQIIYYGDAKNNLFYVFRFDDLKDYIENHYLDEGKAKDYNKWGIMTKVSYGYLVPIKDFMSKYPVSIIDVKNL